MLQLIQIAIRKDYMLFEIIIDAFKLFLRFIGVTKQKINVKVMLPSYKLNPLQLLHLLIVVALCDQLKSLFMILKREFPVFSYSWIFLLSCIPPDYCSEGFDSVIEVKNRLAKEIST